jgi:hypothetical protein
MPYEDEATATAKILKEAHDAVDGLKRDLGNIIAITDGGPAPMFDNQTKQAMLHHICALHDLIDGKPIGAYKLAYTAGVAALNEELQRDENWHEFVSGMFAAIRDG